MMESNEVDPHSDPANTFLGAEAITQNEISIDPPPYNMTTKYMEDIVKKDTYMEDIVKKDTISSSEKKDLFQFLISEKEYKITDDIKRHLDVLQICNIVRDRISIMDPPFSTYLTPESQQKQVEKIDDTIECLHDLDVCIMIDYLFSRPTKNIEMVDSDRLIEFLMNYVVWKIINQMLSYDELNYIINIPHQSKTNYETIHRINTHKLGYMFHMLHYVYTLDSYKNRHRDVISAGKILYANTNNTINFSRTNYLNQNWHNFLSDVLKYNDPDDENELFDSNIANFKQKEKVEQIIYMFVRTVAGVISSMPLSAINQQLSSYNSKDTDIGQYINILNIIHKKYDINRVLQVCQFAVPVMIKIGEEFDLNKKTITVYKRRILNNLAVNPKSCGCQYTDEIVNFEAVMTNKFIIGGSDNAPLEYKHVKNKAYIMDTAHYEPIFEGDRIVKIKYYVKISHNICDNMKYLKSFKFKSDEYKEYMINYYDCNIADGTVNVRGIVKSTVHNQKDINIKRLTNTETGADRNNCTDIYFKMDDILSINFKNIKVHKVLADIYQFDIELAKKIYDFENYESDEFKLILDEIDKLGKDSNVAGYMRYLISTMPNIFLKTTKTWSGDISNVAKNFLNRFPKYNSRGVKIFYVTIIINYIINYYDCFMEDHKKFVFVFLKKVWSLIDDVPWGKTICKQVCDKIKMDNITTDKDISEIYENIQKTDLISDLISVVNKSDNLLKSNKPEQHLCRYRLFHALVQLKLIRDIMRIKFEDDDELLKKQIDIEWFKKIFELDKLENDKELVCDRWTKYEHRYKVINEILRKHEYALILGPYFSNEKLNSWGDVNQQISSTLSQIV